MKKIILLAFLMVPVFSIGQSKWFLKNGIGMSLDGKGDIAGPSFTNAVQYYFRQKHSVQIQHEYFSLKADFESLYTHRTTNSLQLLYGFNTSAYKKYHFEILSGGQIKFHEWRFSSNGAYAVIGARDGLLNLQPNSTLIYKET